jgi:acetyl-CoA/propionyl-CoA carboxylase carboxyl transferase subunit
MGSVAAIRVLHRRQLAAVADAERAALETSLAAEHERLSGGVARAVELDLVDAIIDPDSTRSQVSGVLAATPVTRGRHGNIPL